ncbi:UV-stimulated scaffold protein A isoform X1 [Gadus chalcogrammus]|uniref:UV-stimulated scaffold protein A isoform X1 n=1 Tax=Gadus chalcogrammus TaxID=1042646 RepID=UPI0024C49783|nr:UV-stimulated scaffold protein A isoform X1 [Gadus chalcogrammus]
MDLAQRDKLSELVEELTTSGQQQLNQEKIKEIKKICRLSKDYVDHVYDSVMAQLDKEHAEIRLSAFQIASELFSRSHQFRIRLVDNFQEFLELTVETDSDQPLPPPKEVAKKLKISAIKTIQSWQAQYGTAYKKLALGYHFMKQVKNVDFNDVQARTVAERSRENERQRRMERIYKDRVEAAAKEMEESHQEIETTVTEMKSCLKLLLPDEFGLSDQTAPVPDSRTLGDTAPGGRGPASRQLSEEHRPGSSLTAEEAIGKEKNGGNNERRQEEDEKKCLDARMEEKPSLETFETVELEGREELRMKQEEKEVDRDEEETWMNDVSYEDVFIRNSGLISHSYTLNINVESDVQVKETDDNEAVVSTLIELHHLITTKHLPAVKSWVQVFTRSGPEQLQLLRSALRLKMSLESLLKKEKLLHIDYKTRIRKVTRATADVEEDDEEEDEDDFEEVPEKEGFEPHIPDHLREEYGLEPSASTSAAPPTQRALPKRPAPVVSPSTTARRLRRRLEEERDPTCAAATLHLLKGQMRPCTGPSPRVSEPPSPAVGSAPAGGDGAPDAPIVPFGLDLYYWGEKQPAAGKMIKSTSQHRFWVPSEVDEETENPELLAESSSRYISFPGTFTPVSHHCNALLGNGRLCPRQDRVKCPFHGVIVPRDAHGRPSRAEDRAREEREERRHRESHPDWQDVELMQDIEAATGEDLGSKRLLGKGQGKGKGKYPNLSNLKKSANTSRSRLENKVFNKKSVRRVSEVMTKIDSRKHEKFSNQFNYALN